MNNIAISFGKRIPKMQFQIQKKDTKEYVPAVFSEVDCKDEDDYNEVKNLDRKWTFRNHIAQAIEEKDVVQRFFKQKSNKSIYEMHDEQGQLIGIAQTQTRNGICNIEYIETKPNNEYKYVGQAMVTAIGCETIARNGYTLTVLTPIDEAIPFYTNACGFKVFGDFFLRMNQSQILELIKRTEQKTNASIIDLKG